MDYYTPDAEKQVRTLRENCARFGVELFDFGSDHRGIVHVIGPELGLTQPGMTIVCGDSHTATHGAFGALAFGIGTSEVGHVLATQCLLQRKAKTLAIEVDGELGVGVTAKDLILHVIGAIGVDGGTGHVIEYRGSAIRALSRKRRPFATCRSKTPPELIAPRHVTFDIREHARAPQGHSRARSRVRHAASDDGGIRRWSLIRGHHAHGDLGTHPGRSPASAKKPVANDSDTQRALATEFPRRKSLAGQPVDWFVGSFTTAVERPASVRNPADITCTLAAQRCAARACRRAAEPKASMHRPRAAPLSRPGCRWHRDETSFCRARQLAVSPATAILRPAGRDARPCWLRRTPRRLRRRRVMW